MLIFNDNEDENEISDTIDQVAYGVHVDPDYKDDEDEKYDKYDEVTGKDGESDGRENGDENEDP